MATTTLQTRIAMKHDTEANWSLAENFIPLAGEVIIYDADENHLTPRVKIGDGINVVSALKFELDEAILNDDYVIINCSDFEIIGDNPGGAASSTVTANYIILNSSTEGSNKKFKITIDDGGILTATEV